MNCAPFRGACNHKCGRKSPCTFIDFHVLHLAGTLAIQGLNQPEEVSLEAFWECLLHRFAVLLHAVGL